ncbi:MAG: alpha-ketoglutarate-dependent dioxygenase AlkB [Burkholderia sp.]|nr:alpha-ketoglutarate-dependent dioxygenase AlkB [Burkholderia sp.]
MNLNLFEDAATFGSIPLIDAELKLMQGFYRPPLSEQLRNALLEEVVWTQEKIYIGGAERLQPRLSAWYGDQGKAYTYSGITLDPHPWSPALLRIKEDIETATGHRFNSVLVNLYRDERDSVGWHSDNERELGSAPVIASLSLGETRNFRFKHKSRKDLKPLSLALADGSLLLMSGATQRYWRHAIDKERETKGQRINLTFRNVLSAQ